jgi:hypothetical protein
MNGPSSAATWDRKYSPLAAKPPKSRQKLLLAGLTIEAIPAQRGTGRVVVSHTPISTSTDAPEPQVEIKVIPANKIANMRAVVDDLAALIAVDWSATLKRPGFDAGVDDRWWEDRHTLVQPWALCIALLHGPASMDDPEVWVPDQLQAGLVSLRLRFPDHPSWAIRAQEALTRPLFKSMWSGECRSATMLAWTAPPVAPQHAAR